MEADERLERHSRGIHFEEVIRNMDSIKGRSEGLLDFFTRSTGLSCGIVSAF